MKYNGYFVNHMSAQAASAVCFGASMLRPSLGRHALLACLFLFVAWACVPEMMIIMISLAGGISLVGMICCLIMGKRQDEPIRE